MEAKARFEAMLADPETWEDCGGWEDCIDNVKASLEHYIGFIEKNFNNCVAATLDPDVGTVFEMGNPGCADGGVTAGCIIAGTLDMSCNSVTIDFSSNDGVCIKAQHQPPEPTSRACEIKDGGGEVRGGEDLVIATFTSGSAVTHYYDCLDPECPFVLDGLGVEITDVEDGGVELSDITAELYVAAYGMSDGQDVEFPAGAIRVRVTGTMTDVTGSSPFDVVGATVSPTVGTHDNDLLELAGVHFEAGGYTFMAYIEPSECDPI
ncbi:hypothetical protein [Nannocystis radixulma]|nr:hypothetical protein [Nannocystis radixulma]